MSLELPPDDPWVSRGYGQGSIEPGARPAVLVVDLQTVVAWREDGSDIGLWPLELPLLGEVALDSRWAGVDARLWRLPAEVEA